MGEKIRNLTQIEFKEKLFDIELNKATYKNGPRYVHIQNDSFRLNLTEQEFIEIVCEILKAENKLRELKKLFVEEI